jgi:hypothetical protein
LTPSNGFTQLLLVLNVIVIRFHNALKQIEHFASFSKPAMVKGMCGCELCAKILHGRPLMSHRDFLAFVRDEVSAWCRADDACVSQLKETAVLGSWPCVLFYKRLNPLRLFVTQTSRRGGSMAGTATFSLLILPEASPVSRRTKVMHWLRARLLSGCIRCSPG